MSSPQPTVDKKSCDAETEPSVGCGEGTVDRLNEAQRYQWQVRNVYGQFKTAMSVTRKLRSQGIVARARQRGDGNSVVEVRDGQPG